MKNLDEFKVEELEQRLEMRRWKVIPPKGGGTCSGFDFSNCKLKIQMGIYHYF